MQLNRSILGIIFMLAGTFSLGTNDIVVKGLSFKFPIWEIIFFRASACFISGFAITVPVLILFASSVARHGPLTADIFILLRPFFF